jgi:hypothetical protein
MLLSVRMMWWFLMLVVAAGVVLWAAMSAYLRVQKRLRRAENRPSPGEQPRIDHPHRSKAQTEGEG